MAEALGRVHALLLRFTGASHAWQLSWPLCCGCRLSYKGLGEPICFVAFGPLATTAFYLAHVSSSCSPTC